MSLLCAQHRFSTCVRSIASYAPLCTAPIYPNPPLHTLSRQIHHFTDFQASPLLPSVPYKPLQRLPLTFHFCTTIPTNNTVEDTTQSKNSDLTHFDPVSTTEDTLAALTPDVTQPSAYTKALKEAPEKVGQVLTLMLERNVAFSTPLINQCLIAVCKSGLLWDSLGLLKDIVSTKSHDHYPLVALFNQKGLLEMIVKVVSALVDGAEKQGLRAGAVLEQDNALKLIGMSCSFETLTALLDKLRECGLDPDAQTYSFMLAAAGGSGQLFTLVQMVRVLERSGVVWSDLVYITLVQQFLHYRDVPSLDRVRDRLYAQERIGPRVFQHLLRAYMQLGDVTRTLNFYETLKSKVPPALVIFRMMIDWLGEIGQLEAAERIFSRLIGSSLAPTLREYNALLHAYGKNKNYSRMHELLELMTAKQIQPDKTSYELTIKYLVEGGDLDTAHQIIALMEKSNITPTTAYADMARAYIYGKEFKKAWDLVNKVKNTGKNEYSIVLNALLVALCTKYNKDGSVKVLRMAMADNVPLTPSTQLLVTRALTKWRMFPELIAFIKWVYSGEQG